MLASEFQQEIYHEHLGVLHLNIPLLGQCGPPPKAPDASFPHLELAFPVRETTNLSYSHLLLYERKDSNCQPVEL